MGDADFMTGATEDRCPDAFGLLGVDSSGTGETRRSVARLFAGLPHHAVVLGHDVAAAGSTTKGPPPKRRRDRDLCLAAVGLHAVQPAL
ncbi:hypothetical protein AB0F09_28260 [Streptomyces olivaceus]|uniref:hypothetical protein n=1 Tax=Streptomyces olivaceus TaxID=47716 RepID=UPI0033FC6505